jgi:predicted HTH domain antitoxin
MKDIDFASIADDLAAIGKDRKDARRRSAELVELAVRLVAVGRITPVEAARLAGTSRQRLHDALRRRRPRIKVDAALAAYVDRLWSRTHAAHDRDECRWRADQAKADAEWEASMVALDDEAAMPLPRAGLAD